MPSSRPFSLRRNCSSYPSSVVALAVALPSRPHTPTRVNVLPPVPPATPPPPALPPVPVPVLPPVPPPPVPPPLAPPLPELELPPEHAQPPASARSTHEVMNRRRIDLSSFFI